MSTTVALHVKPSSNETGKVPIIVATVDRIFVIRNICTEMVLVSNYKVWFLANISQIFFVPKSVVLYKYSRPIYSEYIKCIAV